MPRKTGIVTAPKLAPVTMFGLEFVELRGSAKSRPGSRRFRWFVSCTVHETGTGQPSSSCFCVSS